MMTVWYTQPDEDGVLSSMLCCAVHNIPNAFDECFSLVRCFLSLCKARAQFAKAETATTTAAFLVCVY